jgi:hypothetical protein
VSFLRRAVEALAARLGQPRVIYDRDGLTPYLSRFYLSRQPESHDGAEPFDRFGNPKPDVTWPDGWGLYLHRFHRSDADGELHNHPWRWALSLVLVGGYSEERRNGARVIRRRVAPGSLNFIRANDFHRVDLLEHDAWTLFLVGPKSQSWGFWSRTDGAFTPWREFIDGRRAATGSAEAAQ